MINSTFIIMYITGKRIGCFHNKLFLKKKIFAYVYKNVNKLALIRVLGLKDLYVLLKKQ